MDVMFRIKNLNHNIATTLNHIHLLLRALEIFLSMIFCTRYNFSKNTKECMMWDIFIFLFCIIISTNNYILIEGITLEIITFDINRYFLILLIWNDRTILGFSEHFFFKCFFVSRFWLMREMVWDYLHISMNNAGNIFLSNSLMIRNKNRETRKCLVR